MGSCLLVCSEAATQLSSASLITPDCEEKRPVSGKRQQEPDPTSKIWIFHILCREDGPDCEYFSQLGPLDLWVDIGALPRPFIQPVAAMLFHVRHPGGEGDLWPHL